MKKTNQTLDNVLESPRYSPIEKIVREEYSNGPIGSKRYGAVVTETTFKHQRFR